MVHYFVDITCPHCHAVNRIEKSLNRSGATRFISNCDVDSGGCDKGFAVVVYVEVNAASHIVANGADW